MSSLCGLPRAAALAQLARTIWYARALIHKLDVPHWDALALEERHAYLTMAEAVVEAVKPDQPLFEVAVALAREEAARVIPFTVQVRPPDYD